MHVCSLVSWWGSALNSTFDTAARFGDLASKCGTRVAVCFSSVNVWLFVCNVLVSGACRFMWLVTCSVTAVLGRCHCCLWHLWWDVTMHACMHGRMIMHALMIMHAPGLVSCRRGMLSVACVVKHHLRGMDGIWDVHGHVAFFDSASELEMAPCILT